MVHDDPAEAESQILRHLVRLEAGGERTTITVGPWSAYMLVSLCQMAAERFPPGDPQAEAFIAIAAAIEPYFEETAAGDLLAAGWSAVARTRQKRGSAP